MGLLNKLWSGTDFWDKKENKQQRDQFAQQDAERKKREAEARAQAQAQREQQRQFPAPSTVPSSEFNAPPSKPLSWDNRQPLNDIIPQTYKPIQQPQSYKPMNAFDIAMGVPKVVAANLPEVGLAAGRVATGLVQGAFQIPHMVSATAATGTEQLQKHMNNPVTRQLNSRVQVGNTGVKLGTHALVDNTFDPINRGLDRAAVSYNNANSAGMGIGKDVYTKTQIPLNILAALLTMGGSSAGEAANVASRVGESGNVSKLAKVFGSLNKAIPGTSSEGLISKIGGGALEKFSPVANALNTPFGSTLRKAKQVFGAGEQVAPEIAQVATTGAKAINSVPTGPKPNEIAPGVMTTNVKPEIRPPQPVVKPPQAPVKPPIVPKSTDERLAGLKSQRNSLAAERDDILASGGNAKDIEKQIKSLDNAITEHTTPPKTPEARALAQGDKQLEEALAPVKLNKKPEISKQEAPSKPKASEKGVTTRQMTPDEMAARGSTKEQIDAVMAKRGEAPIKVYRGGDASGYDPSKATDRGISVATNKENAQWFGGGYDKNYAAKSGKSVQELELSPNAKVLNVNDVPKETLAGFKKLNTDNTTLKEEAALMKYARSKGYDAVDVAPWGEAEIRVLNPDVLSAPQVGKTVAPEVVRTNPNVKTVVPEPVKVEAPSKPVVPTKSELQKGATDNTLASGKVSDEWQKQQLKNGADPTELRSAIEKVEGLKATPTAKEAQVAANRAENNRIAKENKAAAIAEGKNKQAAPNVTEALAKQTSLSTSSPEEKASIERRYAAQTKGVNIDEGMTKAHASLDKVSDDGILEHAKNLMDPSSDVSDADRVFNGIALTKRLDRMRMEAGDKGLELDKKLQDLAAGASQDLALTTSKGGLITRLSQEIYKNLPSPVRVQRHLDSITKEFEKYGVEFKPTEVQKNELVKLTDTLDKSTTSMQSLDDAVTQNMSDFVDAKSQEARDILSKTHKQLRKDFVGSQESAKNDFNTLMDKFKSIRPELPKGEKFKRAALAAPDVTGNLLRWSMLSSPAGRVRDGLATAVNSADNLPSDLLRSVVGKIFNKTLGTNFVDSMGSVGSVKKGFFGGFSKLKSSWKGEHTLDEATGRIGSINRAELLQKGNKGGVSTYGIQSKKSGSKWNIPKKYVTATVQAPTDLTYTDHTRELNILGRVEGRSKGLSGKAVKQYAEMFMDQPSQEAQIKAGSKWLGNSGMQSNKLSEGLTAMADKLDNLGSSATHKSKDGTITNVSTAQRVGLKFVGKIIRTTTIPFVQYTGGATHAMFMNMNPVVNIGRAGKAVWKKDPQAVIDNLARGGWNTAKIDGLMYAMDHKWLQTSEVDADGQNSYNGPYLVRDTPNGKEYVPVGSLGIAGASALIGAHYANKTIKQFKSGDIIGALGSSTWGPTAAVLKATGMNNMLSGRNVVGGAFANIDQSSGKNQSDSSTGAKVLYGIGADLGSQAVPAVGRDINSFLDQNPNLNPTKEQPSTAGINTITGKVDPRLKAGAQITSGIPFLSQGLPRKSGVAAKTIGGRVLNANTQSAQQAADVKAQATEKTTTINRTADVVRDKNIANLLSDEIRPIYDKYKGDMSKASQEDSKKIWKEVSAAKDRLIDDGQYDSYKKILTYERDEAKAKGSSTATEIGRMDRNITRADIAGKNNISAEIYRLYTATDKDQGGGISQSEFKKMIDPEDDAFDMKTATALWELDKKMTKEGVSFNTDGIDPWTKQKYSMPDDKKGSGSGQDKGVSTKFGTIGAYAKPPSDSLSQKYQRISTPLANLTTSSARTNLKKNISVAKGVRL